MARLLCSRLASRILDFSLGVVRGGIILRMMRDNLELNTYVIPRPLDTSRYILAARSALEGGIFDLD